MSRSAATSVPKAWSRTVCALRLRRRSPTPRDGRTEVEGEHQGGPFQAQLVQEDVPGLEHAVQQATHQGAALGAGVGLQSGALVDVGLGDRAHNPVV
ncbi:hypothetical protein [Streptomyces sp. NPDC058272]|uniref:hypothetical protein n=1 Tax=Streptomyces sp. NPDC058272 TaxID=3346415 RepID=UPI0036ECB4B3